MTKDSLKVSVVVPVYKCHKTLEELVERIRKNLANYSPFEIILINDGCPNSSWDFIQSLSRKFDNVKGIKLSRNFGQHFAIHAGLEHATGEFVVVMDCDLQDEPEEIPRLLKAAEEGYDIILAQRSIRKDTIYKKLTSKIFYGILSYLTS
ncbi:MAG: glycosyltransferase family 2 protein, partial [bacterium]|nr:glycosyltransferase family 2 protein [bacterium]